METAATARQPASRTLPAPTVPALANLDLWGLPLAATLAFVAACLGLIDAPDSEQARLAIHVLLDTTAMTVAVVVFAVGWSASDGRQPSSVSALASVFLGVAVLQFAYLMAMPQMLGFMMALDGRTGVVLSMASRGLVAAGLLGLVLRPARLPGHALRREHWLAAILVAVAVAGALAASRPGWLPEAALAGKQAGAQRLLLEALVLAALLAAGTVLVVRRRHWSPFDTGRLTAAVSLLALSALCSILEHELGEVFELLGDACKAAGFLLIYRAVYLAAVRKPYLDLKRSREAIRLEKERVQHRTLQLARANEALGSEIEERSRVEAALAQRTGELEDARAFLDSLVENLPLMLFVKDAESLRFVRVNRACESVLGVPRERMLGRTDHEILPAEQADAFAAADRQLLASGQMMETPAERVLSAGRGVRLLHTRKVAVSDAAGRPRYLLGLAEDVTERRSAEEGLRLAAQVFDSASEGIVVVSAAGEVVKVNRAFSVMTGYPPREVEGRGVALLAADGRFPRGLLRAAARAGHWQGEGGVRRRDGSAMTALLTVSVVRDEQDRPQHYVGIFNDISDLKAAHQRVEYLANFDSLTGLPNRNLFLDRVRHAMDRSRRSDECLALMFIDLDNFKTVNDSLGHEAGDRLLAEVAERLRASVRREDTVARLGGDEFSVLLEEVADSAEVAVTAERICQALARPVALAGHEVFISASIGVSLFPEDGDDAQALLKNADTAMYQAKDQGKNHYQFFTPSMNDQAYETLVITNALRTALERDEFTLHYQPRVELASGRITGVEALLRWKHPELGQVPPSQFIPIAEASGLIEPIGEWVLASACAQARAWRDAGLAPLRMAVNLSGRQFRRPDLAERVSAILEQHGLPADCLELEITEGMMVSDVERSERVLDELARRGVAVSVDDFGTGYSSLSYLKRFPLHNLKIDRSFVQDAPHDEDDVGIIRAIIAMATSLKLKVIAEGVESDDQRRFLHECGCHEAQGYLFARPQPAEEIVRLLGT